MMIVETQTMATEARDPPTVPRPGRHLGRRVTRALVLYLLPLGVVAGGVVGAKRLIDTAPKAAQRAPEKQATLVQVQPISRINTTARIHVMGSVIAARDILLQPRVSGQVVKLSPKLVPGGRFAAGEFMLQIDPVDYELAIERIKSQVAQAEYELKLEQGYGNIAEREWELLDMQRKAGDGDGELALRRPQLVKATAALKAAQAALREAGLALERTMVHAPFDCMVNSESIDLGSQVSLQTQLARLIGTDEYWVQAAIPIDQLKWISFPAEDHPGSGATIYQELGTGLQGEWSGHVVRLMSGLERQGRMAQVLISVPNPLERDPSKPGGLPLLIDSYVNVTIDGQPVENVFSLPRSALREDGSVWIMDDADVLDIRGVEVVWRNRDEVLVRAGLQEGERLVISELPAPVAGMALAVRKGEVSPARVAVTSPATGPAKTEVVHSAR